MEVAVIPVEEFWASRALRGGGKKMDEVIKRHKKTAYNLMIGDRTAEEIKIKIGSAYPLEQEMAMDVRGRDLVAGLPRTVKGSSEGVCEALSEPLMQLGGRAKSVLEQTPPPLSPG